MRLDKRFQYFTTIYGTIAAPHYNENFYECSDLIMNISKQTVAIVDEVAKNKPRTDWDSTYLPHGVSEKYYYPISIFDDKYKSVIEMKKQLTDEDVEFILFYNNRNIRRKLPAMSLCFLKHSSDMLSEEEANKGLFYAHTTRG